jgi:hypothetical protein
MVDPRAGAVTVEQCVPGPSPRCSRPESWPRASASRSETDSPAVIDLKVSGRIRGRGVAGCPALYQAKRGLMGFRETAIERREFQEDPCPSTQRPSAGAAAPPRAGP